MRGMFIRPCYRMKDGKRHAYWALVESYRTERGPRQRRVAYLGLMDEAGRRKADLIVMGGYSHARLRERLLGGVTYSLMHEAPIPLLMAH